MKPEIELNNEKLWKWMRIGANKDGTATLDDYLRLIADNQANAEHIIKLKSEEQSGNPPDEIMKNLSLLMPRKYFLELQFCAKTFANIFGSVFPPLGNNIEQLAYIEWLLYTEPGYTKYRDHLVHMFKVAFVGDRLLADKDILNRVCEFQFNNTQEKNIFNDWCKESGINLSSLAKEDREQIVKMAFFLASIFHDFGYGYFYHNLYQGRLFKINHWLQPGADLTDIDTPFYQKFKKSLPYYYVKSKHQWALKAKGKQKERLISGFFRDCLPLNHSIASTFTILDIAERLWDVGALNEKLYIAFQLAAEAIMIHDMTGDDNWAHLEYGDNGHFLDHQSCESTPIAITLIMADELAIWERFRMKTEFTDSRSITYKMDSEFVPQKIEIEISKDEFLITPYYDTSEEKKYSGDYDVLGKKFHKDLDFLHQKGTLKFLNKYKVRIEPESFEELNQGVK